MAAIPDNIRASLGEEYDFERELVGGGMARVFLAVDREFSVASEFPATSSR